MLKLENPNVMSPENLLEQDFVWIKDNQPWGTCATYCQPSTGQIRYYLKGKYVTRTIIEEYLRNDWILDTPDENTWKWQMLSTLDWDQTGKPDTPKTPEELRQHLSEILRANENLTVRLQNPEMDLAERMQILETLSTNLGLAQGLKWALGAA